MKIITFISLLLFSFSVNASQLILPAQTKGNRDNVINKFDTDCPEKVKTLIPPQYRDLFKNEAVLLWEDGKDYAACWTVINNTVFIFDETGQMIIPLPLHLFKGVSI